MIKTPERKSEKIFETRTTQPPLPSLGCTCVGKKKFYFINDLLSAQCLPNLIFNAQPSILLLTLTRTKVTQLALWERTA